MDNQKKMFAFTFLLLPTLKELIFAGTKFRGFWGHPQNLIPAKRKNLTICEI